MAFTVVAQYRVVPEEVQTVHEALRQMLEPTRAEPGCRSYQVYVDPSDELRVVLVETYADEAAFQAHLASPHFERWLRGTVLPRLTERTRWDLIPLDTSDGEA
ncbi:MAG TPA: putative quinol monooxygenase [Actinomycetes bacterium]|nr:putative quinol monooxygenase [Actinomycetes bacterium]